MWWTFKGNVKQDELYICLRKFFINTAQPAMILFHLILKSAKGRIRDFIQTILNCQAWEKPWAANSKHPFLYIFISRTMIQYYCTDRKEWKWKFEFASQGFFQPVLRRVNTAQIADLNKDDCLDVLYDGIWNQVFNGISTSNSFSNFRRTH